MLAVGDNLLSRAVGLIATHGIIDYPMPSI
jgi:hypothetical protein